MIKIELRKGDDLDKVLRKFKTKIRREGLIDELRDREHYEKPSQKRRKKEEKAKRRETIRRKKEQL